MPLIYYIPDDMEIEAGEKETVLETSLRAGIPHAHACGGNARCSTCRVLILEGVEYIDFPSPKEKELTARLGFSPEIRLACQIRVSNNVKLRRLVLDDEDLKLTTQLGTGTTPGSVGEEKRVAILFADIRGFTPFAESLLPYDVIYVLNRYFNQMGQIINRNGGYIDNYMGDGLMALFGVEDVNEAAVRAVRAGLEMLEAVERLKPYLESVYEKSFQIGIGLHYGEVVLGTIGAKNMKRITAIGDAVNLASRIEAANKEAGTRFLISEETYYQVMNKVRAEKRCVVTLPGKSGEYKLYEVTGLIAPKS